MSVPIVREGWYFIVIPTALAMVLSAICLGKGWDLAGSLLLAAGVINGAFMLYFFRDPERSGPDDPHCIVAGADGRIRAIERLQEQGYLGGETIRVSTFLSPFNVHVNRSPMAGQVKALKYTPGKKLLTIQNAASEYNEHSSILIEGEAGRCLVRQIVGPIVRRVVYWLKLEQSVERGERIGLMKFGSRLDMHFPASDVQVVVEKGDKVRAGETVIAILKKEK